MLNIKPIIKIILFLVFIFLFGCNVRNNQSENRTLRDDTSIQHNEPVENKNRVKIVNKKKLLPSEYIQWVNNPVNGLCQTKIIGGFKYVFQYEPVGYVVLRNNRQNKISDDDFEKEEKKIEGFQYFSLKLFAPNDTDLLKYQVTNQEDYNKRLEYFSFHLQKDIKLIEGADTLSCSLYHFERTYSITPYVQCLIGFEAPFDEVQDMRLILIDELFGNGIIKIKFDQKDLQRIPQVKNS